VQVSRRRGSGDALEVARTDRAGLLHGQASEKLASFGCGPFLQGVAPPRQHLQVLGLREAARRRHL
jgi:hypothetical protein